jgi:hypothetical protein
LSVCLAGCLPVAAGCVLALARLPPEKGRRHHTARGCASITDVLSLPACCVGCEERGPPLC